MLKKRVIPKLLVKRLDFGGKLREAIVATKNYDSYSVVGDPVSQAKIYESNAVDELMFLDIDAYRESRLVSVELVDKLASEIFMPFTVGGGVRKLDDFREILKNGADKVCINSSALEDTDLIPKAADVFGSQCVVLSIDYRWVNGMATVFGFNGVRNMARAPLDWALEAQRLGVGEVVLCCMDHDGTRSGLDINVLRQVTSRLTIPVIATGGVGTTQHFIEGFMDGEADAVAAGTFFAFKDESPVQTRAHVKIAGVPLR